MVILYLLTAADSSVNQSALPTRKIGFFNKFCIVLTTRSAILGLLSVNGEK